MIDYESVLNLQLYTEQQLKEPKQFSLLGWLFPPRLGKPVEADRHYIAVAIRTQMWEARDDLSGWMIHRGGHVESLTIHDALPTEDLKSTFEYYNSSMNMMSEEQMS